MQFQKISHVQRRNELLAVLNGIEPDWLEINDRIEWGKGRAKTMSLNSACSFVERKRLTEATLNFLFGCQKHQELKR